MQHGVGQHQLLVGGGRDQIGLGHFLTGALADVAQLHRDIDRLAHRDAGGDGRLAIVELRIAQAMAEAPGGLAGEVTIGALLHAVIGKGGQVGGRLIDGDGQATRRVDVTAEDLGQRGAAFGARIEGGQRRGGLEVAQRHRRTRHDDRDHGLAGRLERGEQLALRLGQDDLGPVAACETGDRDAQCLALQIGRQADDRDQHIGGPGDLQRLGGQCLSGRQPLQAQAFVTALMVDLDPDTARGRAVDGGFQLLAADHIVHDQLVVDVELHRVMRGAGVPAGGAVEAELVLARPRRGQHAGPATLEGRGLGIIEVDAAILTRSGPLAVRAHRLDGQAGLAVRRQRGFGHADERTLGQHRALRITNVAAELRADAVERGDGVDRGAVIIALQHAQIVGIRAEHRERLALERQNVVRVVEQDDALARRLQRQRAVGGGADFARLDPVPGRIHRQHPPHRQRAGKRGVDLTFGNQAALHRLRQREIGLAAIQVGTRT